MNVKLPVEIEPQVEWDFDLNDHPTIESVYLGDLDITKMLSDSEMEQLTLSLVEEVKAMVERAAGEIER